MKSQKQPFGGEGVLNICSKFTGEHPHRSAISIKLHFSEIAILHWCSPINLLHIFRTPFPKNTSERLSSEITNAWKFKKKKKKKYLPAFFIFFMALFNYSLVESYEIIPDHL